MFFNDYQTKTTFHPELRMIFKILILPNLRFSNSCGCFSISCTREQLMVNPQLALTNRNPGELITTTGQVKVPVLVSTVQTAMRLKEDVVNHGEVVGTTEPNTGKQRWGRRGKGKSRLGCLKEKMVGGNAPTEVIHTNNSELTMASSMSDSQTTNQNFLLTK